jgi:hypothetical protein
MTNTDLNKNKLFQKTLTDIPCGTQYEEKTFELTDNPDLTDIERKEILHHLNTCDYCRHMLETITLINIEIENEVKSPPVEIKEKKTSWGEIIIRNVEKGLHIIDTAFQPTRATALVLSENDVNDLLEFDIPEFNKEPILQLIENNKSFSIRILAEEEKMKYYLLSGGEIEIATSSDGIAEFSNIKSESVLLTDNFQDYIKIVMQ